MLKKTHVFRTVSAVAVLLGMLLSISCQGPTGPSSGSSADPSAELSAEATTGQITDSMTTVADGTSNADTTALPVETDTAADETTTDAITEAPPSPETTSSQTEAPKPEPTTAPEVTSQPEITTRPEVTNNMQQPETPSVMNYADKKCMWISQFDLYRIYTSGLSQRSKSQFTKYIKNILSNVKDNGINTIIVQVRPYADSMYPSEVYPMSSYTVGDYGKEATYDPFRIIIDEAHALDLSVHAWINPMRAMLANEIFKIPTKYRIRSWYDDPATRGKYVVTVSNRLYLNPAYPEVRQLIIDGAKEILANYKVDGLHMDDYFYPTTDASFDSAAYSAYKKDGGKLSLADYRRDCLSQLVAGLYSAVKAADQDILFGISPAGNINTVYEKQFADVYRWCSEAGYLDYICPQVYFGLEHQTYDFKKVSNTFQSIIKLDSVELIIGMTLGKAKSGVDQYAGSGKNEWTEHKDVLVRCLEYTKSLPKCRGVAYFCYQYFYDPISGVSVHETKTERSAFVPLLKTISWQDKD